MTKLYPLACLLLILVVCKPAFLSAQPQTQSIYYTNSTSADGRSNVTVGPYAGTGGTLTVNLGAFAGQINAASGNVFVGYKAGLQTTSGSVNVFLGSLAGNTNTTGSANAFIGSLAGNDNISGAGNAFLGSAAGYNNTTGSSNAIVGYAAGYNNVSGQQNTFMGANASYFNQRGYGNVSVGSASGYTNVNSNFNVMVGDSAGYSNTASYNVFMGSKAGYYSTTGDNNSFIGAYAGYANTTGSANNFSGNYAGYNNTSGSTNSFFGYSAGYSNTIGTANTLVGWGAGSSNQRGSQNTIVGYQAGGSLTSSSNTLFGYQAGSSLTTGSNNIIIGPNSGTTVTTGNDNVLMGYNSQAEDGLKNATAIGAYSRVAISDAVILGNQANVGIGTSAPTSRLDVNSGVENESGVRLSRLTANSPVQLATADKVLTVDATGRIVLTQAGRFSVGSVADWSDKVFAPSYRLQSLSEVERYISQNQHLPGIPSAAEVVEKGIEAAKMDARLLEKIEELTLYSIQLEKELRSSRQQQQNKIDQLEQLVKQLLEKK